MNFYNENDPKTAAWLRELIARDLIAPGVVDERSIEDIAPSELEPFVQCHFFAGIGGWPLAFRLAGWPDDKHVWSGSCPCQPFSQAGAGAGIADERHLWPAFKWLIQQQRPATVFGEQVTSALGRTWLAGVFADLEDLGYSRAGADLCAAGVGAPHIRQRLYWVADATKRQRTQLSNSPSQGHESRPTNGGALRMGDTVRAGWEGTFDVSSGKQSSECEPRYKRIVGADGKARRIPVESALFPLADGLPYKLARRGSTRPALLHGAGNAIVPQVAAEFIAAFTDCLTL